MGGREVEITWHGHRAVAWVPDRLADLRLDLTVDVARRTERAAAAVHHVGDRLPSGWEPLARLLLRAEGIASSNIEGLRAPVAAVAAAELDDKAVSVGAAEVADNLAVVADALDAARATRRLTVKELHAWQRRLLHHGTLPDDLVGRFRDRQGWIGGRGPQDASYVPPPADLVPALVQDLVAFVNRDDIDAVTHAAIAHAQFETIHPYGDGNGRVGRLLVLWVLARRLEVTVPPPTSVLIARDAGGYLSGLHWFRTGDIDRWVGWFAGVVESGGQAALEWADDVDALMQGWRARVDDLRADAAARKIIELLPAHPVVSSALVARELGVSDTAARAALDVLGSRGILEPYRVEEQRPGRPRRWWLARGVADLVGGWA